MDTTFVEFSKIPRLSREMIVTEKIDGTNACVYITDEGHMFAGSRTRWITPVDDNFGFAKWVLEHNDELMLLGPGRHFGEWWGPGIQRGYGLKEKKFSLFNVSRWVLHGETPGEKQGVLPPCVGLVPVLYRGEFNTDMIESVLIDLRIRGSMASPGFMRPEGVVVYHVAGGYLFKKTLEKDETPKGKQNG